MAILNSTIIGLFKHFYGRYAGSEGTLKTEVVDALLLEVPSPVGASEAAAFFCFEKVCQREVTHLVEQDFLDCHDEVEMRELQAKPLGLPIELQPKDRRELDLLVFELLGVPNAKRREELVDKLYSETARYYREQRIQDIQSTINRRQGKGGKEASHIELAKDAWNEMEPEWRQPFATWLQEKTGKAKLLDVPDGEVRLPDAGNFFEATTVYFGKNPAVSFVCENRAEAELLYAIAKTGLRGTVSLPTTEKECNQLSIQLTTRLSEGRKKLEQMAEQRAGTDKLREQVLEILQRWFIQGKSD